MKRKIFLSLFFMFLLSAAGASLVMLYIRNTTATLNRLINLHQIEDLRQNLIISLQTVQSDLYTVHTNLGHRLDPITNNVANLEEAAKKCSGCHHAPRNAVKLEQMQSLIGAYETAMSYYITASANAQEMNVLKLNAAEIGNKLLTVTEGMSRQASTTLKVITQDAMKKIENAWMILLVSVSATFIFGIIVATRLTRAVTGPIGELVNATRMLASGDLGFTLDLKDKTEFGEMAKHFNVMSRSLKDSYEILEQEIHERKQTEASLVKSEAFLNTIFDSIHDPFCIFDRTYTIVRANGAYARMKNKKLGDLLGKTCFEALQDRGEVCNNCIIEKTFASGDPFAKEKEEDPSSGIKLWRDVYTYPIVDSGGNVSHVIEYSRDITDRKRAEEALKESEERYALAARGANDGLWDWNLLGKKIYFSDRWKSMLGFSQKEITDNPDEWLGRVHPDDRGALEAGIEAHLKRRDSHFEGEYRIMHKDGTYRWMLTRGLAVRTGDGYAYRLAGSQTDITLRKKAEEQLAYDAFHDALTGLPNRALFMDRLQHVITASQRSVEPHYAALFLDLDRFKIVNDTLGHAIGDQLLIVVSRRLSECIRPGDTVARLGGDEFAVLLENISELKDAVDVAQRIHEKMSTSVMVKGHEVFSSVSIGIALGSDHYEQSEQVLRDADIAMYQSKARGNASYAIFDEKMHATILDRQQLESDLRGAIDHKDLVLHYQPIINLKTHRVVGFEALVRWNHATRGLIHPMEFIPLAEENGLINAIGEWILREACHELKKLQELFPVTPPLNMSVNISSKQFTRQDLAGKLKNVLEETGLDPHTLVYEITESMIMEDVDAAAATMKRLQDMGVRIHIDDFGTGYSSLSYLHHFPINALKIDRTFIDKLSSDSENHEVILSIISLAKSLNFDVIAEGIELTHQLSTVKELHCHYGQGFLFAEPMDSNGIEEWMKQKKIYTGNAR